jgi:hypothetical protein
LDFALFLRERQRIQAWETIDDMQATALRDEFATENLALAEEGMADYLSLLQEEDNA